MGSIIAGLKAGVIAGIAYIGILMLANMAILYGLKQDILTYITNNPAQVCSPVSSVNATTIQDCFNSLAPFYLPFIGFFGFFVVLVYSAVFGRLYDLLPARIPALKGLLIAPFVALSLVYLQLLGLTFEPLATDILVVVLLVSTTLFGVILGRFYKRYTRVVQFVSEDDAALRIIVGRGDLTGKTTTIAANSANNIEAKVADDSSFKGWSVSGGVTVEDAKSFETTMEVNGDGLLKGLVAKKY